MTRNTQGHQLGHDLRTMQRGSATRQTGNAYPTARHDRASHRTRAYENRGVGSRLRSRLQENVGRTSPALIAFHLLGPEWVRYWARKGIDPEAMRRRDMRKISRRVQAWRAGETIGESDPELLLRQMQMLLDSGDAARLRRAGGLSLRETADLVGVTKNAVHKWERKVAKPDGEHAMMYARLLDDLLCGGT